MLSKLFWKISAATFIGFGILLTGCAKDDPSLEEVNTVIAERLDLTEEQAARVEPRSKFGPNVKPYEQSTQICTTRSWFSSKMNRLIKRNYKTCVIRAGIRWSP